MSIATWQDATTIIGVSLTLTGCITAIYSTVRNKEAREAISAVKVEFMQQINAQNARLIELEAQTEIYLERLAELKELITTHSQTDLDSLDKIDSKISDIYKLLFSALVQRKSNGNQKEE